METVLCMDIPVQMISCTDTDGKITPMRFRFRDRAGELVTVNIEDIVSSDQGHGSLGADFVCTAALYGTRRTFRLRYSYHSHKWRMAGVGF